MIVVGGVVAEERVGSRRARLTNTFRPEIQALRAVAVMIVVTYHLWPHLLPGGFVGVDVFFVISGFLITAHLMKEIDRTGRISLTQFWARRARRLLPASLLVLAATLVGVITLTPQLYWQQFFKEIIASALYVQNWALAADSIDYLAAENVASPTQHFWSLSVEEQFYLAWPLLILLTIALTHKKTQNTQRLAILTTLALTAIASLIVSIHLTATSAGQAYFVTPTRAWEFAAGGILAILGTAAASHHHTIRTTTAWAGWLAMTITVFTYSAVTPFPSYTALLPVLATVAIIWAGEPNTTWSPNRLLTTKPIIFLGNTSYSIYLWHWPLIIFAAFTLGDDFRWWIKILLLALTITLAWATMTLVENPIRTRSILTRHKPRWTLTATLITMTLIVTPALIGWNSLIQQTNAETARAAQLLANATPCFGAAALDPTRNCSPTTTTLVPNPTVAIDDKPEIYSDGCYSHLGDPLVHACTIGDVDSAVRVALIGDSHAASWYPALKEIATEQGWALTTYMKSACPQSAALKSNEILMAFESCREWNAELVGILAEADPFDYVFVSHRSTEATYDSDAIAVEGFRGAWLSLTKRGSRVVVLHDIPLMLETTSECLLENIARVDECSLSLTEAEAEADLMVTAAQGEPGISVVDMTKYICDASVCAAAIGGVVVYRDSHHLTATYSQTLAPYLTSELDRIGVSVR